MEHLIIVVCLILMVASGLACAMQRSMLKATISLALLSSLLAIVMFLMGAPWAALFELSVCAGLVTVVFVSAVSLTTPNRRDEAHTREHRTRFAVLPFLLIFSGIAMITLMLLSGFDVTVLNETADPALAALRFKDVFWQMRQADVLGQIIVVLAGAFAVVILFKESDKA